MKKKLEILLIQIFFSSNAFDKWLIARKTFWLSGGLSVKFHRLKQLYIEPGLYHVSQISLSLSLILGLEIKLRYSTHWLAGTNYGLQTTQKQEFRGWQCATELLFLCSLCFWALFRPWATDWICTCLDPIMLTEAKSSLRTFRKSCRQHS